MKNQGLPIVGFVLFVMLWAGCRQQLESPPVQPDKAQNTGKHQGYYVHGNEVSTFQPCNADIVYWLSGSDDMMQMLQAQYAALGVKEYTPVYAVIIGQDKGKGQLGYAAEYDRVMEAQRLETMDKKAPPECKMKRKA